MRLVEKSSVNDQVYFTLYYINGEYLPYFKIKRKGEFYCDYYTIDIKDKLKKTSGNVLMEKSKYDEIGKKMWDFHLEIIRERAKELSKIEKLYHEEELKIISKDQYSEIDSKKANELYKKRREEEHKVRLKYDNHTKEILNKLTINCHAKKISISDI